MRGDLWSIFCYSEESIRILQYTLLVLSIQTPQLFNKSIQNICN